VGGDVIGGFLVFDWTKLAVLALGEIYIVYLVVDALTPSSNE